MKKIISLLVLVSCVLTIASCGSGGKTLVSIDGKKITEGDLDFLSTLNPRLKVQISTPFGRKQILDNLVEQELLYQAALKKGLQRESDVRAKLDLYKKVVIGQAFVEDYISKSAKDYYTNHKDEFEKLQLSHIVVKYAKPKDSKAKKGPPEKNAVTHSKDAALKLANEAKARLDKGEEFAKVAKDVSEDNTSKNNGGDLGKVGRSDPRLERRGYLPLVDKALTMQVGEVAGPIETQEGYHLITVTKGLELQPFEDAEQGIVFKIQGDQRSKLMADLKKNSKITFADEKKGKPSTAPVMPAMPPQQGPMPGQPGMQPPPQAHGPHGLMQHPAPGPVQPPATPTPGAAAPGQPPMPPPPSPPPAH